MDQDSGSPPVAWVSLGCGLLWCVCLLIGGVCFALQAATQVAGQKWWMLPWMWGFLGGGVLVCLVSLTTGVIALLLIRKSPAYSTYRIACAGIFLGLLCPFLSLAVFLIAA